MPISSTEYTLFAASAYRSTRDPENRIFKPEGLTPISNADLLARLHSMGLVGPEWNPTSNSGFEAVAYKKGDEVVIAFAGTAPLRSALGDLIAESEGCELC